MKKLVIIMFAAIMALTTTSCNRNDHWINKYEKAIEQGEYEQAAQYLDKIDQEKLTVEQSTRIAEISTAGAYGAIRGGLLKATHELGEELNKDADDEEDDE